MKRKALSILLAFCMVFGLLPVSAMAEEAAQITVIAGEAAYSASYVGTGGGESQGAEAAVYAVQIPGKMEISISDAAVEGGINAGNLSGSILMECAAYPVTLSEDELSSFVMTEEQKAAAADFGIDFAGSEWACIILTDENESRQYLFLMLGEAQLQTAAEIEVPVADNVIDITDRKIWSMSSNYYVNATNITVTGADVVSATEDGTTVNIVLDSDTPADAEVSVTFGGSGKNGVLKNNTGSVVLSEGIATLTMTIRGEWASSDRQYATATYTLNFSKAEALTEVPSRVMEKGSAETYTGVPVEISLKDYFSAAATYYLVEGENKTELEGNKYSFVSSEKGTYTLTFAAANELGYCPDYATVTVEVKEVQSGAWIGYETSNGSVDYVLFTDAEGNKIDGLTASYESNVINVMLPQSHDPAGKITARFYRTANSSDFPYLTGSNTFNKAYSNRTDIYTSTLSSGAATATMYLYNLKPGATSNNYTTWKINYKVFNNVPTLVEGASATEEKTITALSESYTVNLAELFTDKDAQTLSYKVSVNGGSYTACDADYSYTNSVAGSYTLVFKANDGTDDSEDTYTVTLTVKNSDITYDVPVSVDETVSGLSFYANSLSGEVLNYAEGKVQVPQNVSVVWWSTVDGMNGTAAVSEGSSLTLQLTTFVVKTALGDVDTGAAVTVTDPDGNLVSGSGYTYLLISGEGYTFKAAPGSSYSGGWATNTLTGQTVSTDPTAEIIITLAVKSPKTITVDKDAEIKVFFQSAYFKLEEVKPVYSTDNGDTITYTYSCPNKTINSTGYMYFAKKEGLIDKAGYLHDVTNTTVTWANETRTGSYRGSYDLSTTFGSRGDDSVFVNINSTGHLVLGVGSTHRLRALRIWEIIDHDSGNVMIEPDYIYTRYGDDVLSFSQVTNVIPGTSGNNWVDMTATGSGTAFLEVGYEAVHIVDGPATVESGGSYYQPSDYVYNASDPARTALVVVQTDGNAAGDVSLGIKNNNGNAWDAEFDTLYFTGDKGQITFTPSATSGIGSVAVSNNKGTSWATLTADESGAYTADIVSGANIIRVTNASGQTAYQIVRGDKVSVTITNITSGKESTADIVPGDTVSVKFTGMHAPAGKISGIYNAKAHQLSYLWNGARVSQSDYSGYNVPANTHIEVTIPTETVENYTLSGGYVSYSSYGDPFGSHRKLTDSGKAQNMTADTQYANRTSLPDVEIPVVLPEYSVTLTEGEGYTIAASEGSESPVREGRSFSFTVTVSEGYEGTPVVKANDTALTVAEGVYTIENITADVTVTVSGISKIEEDKIYGDLDGNGEVDVFDASRAYSIANGKTEATEEQLAVLDVNGDGEVDVFDAAMIYSYANGKRNSFPVEEQ